MASPKAILILILRTYGYVTINGKGKWRLQMELRLLINKP